MATFQRSCVQGETSPMSKQIDLQITFVQGCKSHSTSFIWWMVKAWCSGLLNHRLCRIWQHGGDPVQRTTGRGLRRWRGAPAAGQLYGQGRPTKRPSGREVGTSRKYSVFLSFCSWRILQGRVWEILATKFRFREGVPSRGRVWDADVNTDVWRCNVTLWQPTRGRCLEASKEKRFDAECRVFQHPWLSVVKDKTLLLWRLDGDRLWAPAVPYLGGWSASVWVQPPALPARLPHCLTGLWRSPAHQGGLTPSHTGVRMFWDVIQQ